MTIDYDKIVEDFDISELTKKKITASFIRGNFEDEISDLRTVLSVGNVDLEGVYGNSPEPEIINQKQIQMQSLFMGQEMTTEIWLGFVASSINGKFIRTVNHNGQIILVSYDKKLPIPEPIKISQEVGDIHEKDIVLGLKKALIKRF